MNTQVVANSSKAYVRQEPAEVLPPPGNLIGPLAWMRDNLFSSPGNVALTVIAALIAYLTIPGFINFLLIDAVWTGADREACIAKNGRHAGGLLGLSSPNA